MTAPDLNSSNPPAIPNGGTYVHNLIAALKSSPNENEINAVAKEAIETLQNSTSLTITPLDLQELKDIPNLWDNKKNQLHYLITSIFVCTQYPSNIATFTNEILKKAIGRDGCPAELIDNIAKAINALKPDKRARCVNATVEFFTFGLSLDLFELWGKENTKEKAVPTVLQMFAELPEADTSAITASIKEMSSNIGESDLLSTIETLKTMPNHLKLPVARLCEALFQVKTERGGLSCSYRNVKPLPVLKILKLSQEFLVKEIALGEIDMDSPDGQKNLSQFVSDLKEDLVGYLTGVPLEGAIKILAAIHELPKGQHIEILRYANTVTYSSGLLLVKYPSLDPLQLIELLKAVADIPTDRKGVVDYAKYISKRYGSEFTISSEIETLKDAMKTPKDEREKRIALAYSLLTSPQQTHSVDSAMVVLMRLFHKETIEMCTNIGEGLKLLIKEDTAFDNITECVRCMTGCDNDQLDNFPNLIRGLERNQEDTFDIRQFIRLLFYIKKNDRTKEVAQDCFTYCRLFPDTNLHTLFLFVLQPDFPLVFKQFAKNEEFKDATLENFFKKMAKVDAKFIERVHEKISWWLDDTYEDKFSLKVLVASIINDRKNLYLDDFDHPLMRKAIKLYPVLDPEILKQKKHPVTVITNVMQKLSEDLLPCSPPVIAGQQMNIDAMREIANRKTLTYGDLPKINKNLIREMLENLKKPERKDDVEKYLGMTIEKLEALFYQPSAVVGQLLRRELLADHEPVNHDMYYLYNIVNELDKLPNEARKGRPLSPREEDLVSFGYCLLDCITGQGEALPKYYNVIRMHNAALPEGKEDSEREIENQIDISVFECQEEIVGGDAFLEEITGKPAFQQVHYARFIKNRMHKQIGMKHTLAFDEHTELLPDNLIDAPASELLAPIISKYIPDSFIASALKHFNAILEGQHGQKQVNKIYSYLQAKFPELTTDDIFTEKEKKKSEGTEEKKSEGTEEKKKEGSEEDRYLITRLAAQKLLEARGYLYIA